MSDRVQVHPADVADVDILIVGADPVGLHGASCAGSRGLRVAVLDFLPEPGGPNAFLYPDRYHSEDDGRPPVRAHEFVAGLVEQANRFSPIYLLGRKADALTSLSDAENGAPRFLVTTDNRQTIRCGAIIVTRGIGNFTPRPFPSGSEYFGRSRSYFAPDPAAMAGKDVVIAGGGDSAADWAIELHEIAGSVTLVHRHRVPRVDPRAMEQIKATSMRVLTGAQITSVEGADAVENVTVERHEAGESYTLPCQALIAAVGSTMDVKPFVSWGIDVGDRRRILVDACMSSEMRGIFAAGDIIHNPLRMRPVVLGFAEVATAVVNASVLLDPTSALEAVLAGRQRERVSQDLDQVDVVPEGTPRQHRGRSDLRRDPGPPHGDRRG